MLLLLGIFDASFDFAHRVKVFVYFAAVGRRKVRLQPLGVFADEIQYALASGCPAGANFRGHAQVDRSEHALEYNARICFRRHRG